MSDGLAGRGAGLGVGSAGFVETHGLRSDADREAAGQVARQISDGGLRTVRLIVVDQHGIPRAKYLSGAALVSALDNGSDFSGAIYSLDTGNGVFPPAFAAGGGFGIEEMTGFPDVTLVPDPATFRVLPYADRTGWILSDAYFANGKPIPLDGRGLLRRQLDPPRRAWPGALCRHRGRAVRDPAGARVDRARRDGAAGPAGPTAGRRGDRARLPVPLG